MEYKKEKSYGVNKTFKVEQEKFSFDKIVLSKENNELIKLIIDEYQNKDFLSKYNLNISNKIVFEGEPGCGKTMLTFILGNELGKKVRVVNLSQIINQFLGETSKNIGEIFSNFNKNEEILFLDEFDIVGRSRNDKGHDQNEMKRVVNTILQTLDFFPKDGMVIFATNDIKNIDPAILRRMDHIINIGKPSEGDILEYIKILMSNFPKIKFNIDENKLSKDYNGMSYSNIQRDFVSKLKRKVISLMKEGKNRSFKIETEDLQIKKES